MWSNGYAESYVSVVEFMHLHSFFFYISLQSAMIAVSPDNTSDFNSIVLNVNNSAEFGLETEYDIQTGGKAVVIQNSHAVAGTASY